LIYAVKSAHWFESLFCRNFCFLVFHHLFLPFGRSTVKKPHKWVYRADTSSNPAGTATGNPYKIARIPYCYLLYLCLNLINNYTTDSKICLYVYGNSIR
jgi:hypothetical protein